MENLKIYSIENLNISRLEKKINKLAKNKK